MLFVIVNCLWNLFNCSLVFEQFVFNSKTSRVINNAANDMLHLLVVPGVAELLELLPEEGGGHLLDHRHALPALSEGLTLPAQQAADKTVVC